MKVKLIFPTLTQSEDQFYAKTFLDDAMSLFLGCGTGKANASPPLSLLMLAAVTPHDVELEFVDERIDKIDLDEDVDLVGISVVTRAAPRAYQVADEFRKRGVAVILGGIHPSVLPREAKLHADAIVIGEGEKVWPQLLDDFGRGCLREFYDGGHQTDLNSLPLARRDIVPDPDRYMSTKVVAASRGCQNSCTFCSAGLAVGKKYRTRSVRDVVDEVDSLPGKYLYFADDNLGWDVQYAKELFAALIPLKVKWIGALTVSALEDVELVDLMAKSGCLAIDLGFESLSPKVITAIKKHRTNDPDRYPQLIKRVHDRGVPIFGNFMVGFDDDDQGVFGQLIDFINETCIEDPSVNILMPYPGSSIFRQYEKEGRLLHKDWTYYDTAVGYLVYQPRQMTPEELIDGYLMVTREIHNQRAFLRRILGAGTLRGFGTLLGMQFNLRKRANVERHTPGRIRALALAKAAATRSTASSGVNGQLNGSALPQP
jgi:radical SAM superfamily enzyme YgiQ (UPF0313 family)